VPGLYNDVLIRASQESSSIYYTTTAVAYIKHGIVSSLIGFPVIDVYSIQSLPNNNTVYTVYATNSAYYRDNVSGGYITYLQVQTTSGNSFELQFDLLALIDG
jgi:hypothetical protein